MGMATAIPVNVYKINKKEDKAMKQKFMELVVQQLNKVSYRDLVLAKQGHFDKIQYFEHDKKLNRKQTEYINDLIHEFENHEKNYDGVVYRIHGEYVENVKNNYYVFALYDGADDRFFYNLSKEQCETICSFIGINFNKKVQIIIENCEEEETIDIDIYKKTSSKRHEDWYEEDSYSIKVKKLRPIWEQKIKCEIVNDDKKKDSFKSGLIGDKPLFLIFDPGFPCLNLDEQEELIFEYREAANSKNLYDFLNNKLYYSCYGRECHVYDKRSDVLTRWWVESTVIGYRK